MIASFHGGVTTLLVVTTVLLAFVVSHLVVRLFRLEARLVATGRDIFTALVGKTLPDTWLDPAAQMTRVLLLSEDCPACRLVAADACERTPQDHKITLAWRGEGVAALSSGSAGLRIIRDAKETLEALGVKVMPLELWVNQGGEIVAARPAMRSRGAAARPVPRLVALGGNA